MTGGGDSSEAVFNDGLPCSSLSVFARQRAFAEHCLDQITDAEFFARPAPGFNSCAIIVRHMAGNMMSRWGDFPAMLRGEVDGEKPGRDRPSEFVEPEPTAGVRIELMERWDAGWRAVRDALEPLTANDLRRTITIRGETHTVTRAILRQVDHYGSHVGQIALIARLQFTRSRPIAEWQWFTIPPTATGGIGRIEPLTPPPRRAE